MTTTSSGNEENMIILSSYKDRPALIVQSGRLQAAFLYQDGGKMISLKDRTDGQEFLVQRPGEEYKVLEYDGSYVDSECSAFDDLFPTVDPWTPEEGDFSGLTYPDHGEICRMPMEVRILGEKVILSARSKLFRFLYQKQISCGAGGGIDLTYQITNQNDAQFPFVWAAHCMLQGQDDCRVLTPFGEENPRVMMFGPDSEEERPLPYDRLCGFDAEEGPTYKYYFAERVPAGFCGIQYGDGKKLMFRYDKKKIPFLGIWLNNGMFQGLYNIALEPCTCPYDSPGNAMEHGIVCSLRPRETLTFTIRLMLE